MENSRSIKVALIVATADNGVIGKDNALPWKISDDLKYFKSVTMGLPIVMGRKTYDSIRRPLPGRPNIVITRQQGWEADGVIVVSSVEQALSEAKALALELGVEQVMVMGGAEVYKQSLPSVDRIYQTQVHADVEGDAYFSIVDLNQWKEVSRESHEASDRNEYPFSFVIFEKSHKSAKKCKE